MSLTSLYASMRAKGLPFLLAGVWNTAFGYGATVGLYYWLRPWLHLVVIAALANVVCITMSFLTYKIFIFKTAGGWFREYLRCYVVYGGNAVVGIAGLWFLVDILGIPLWLAQFGLMGVGVVLSFIGHELFTFQKSTEPSCATNP